MGELGQDKAFVAGVDKAGHPTMIARVRNHKIAKVSARTDRDPSQRHGTSHRTCKNPCFGRLPWLCRTTRTSTGEEDEACGLLKQPTSVHQHTAHPNSRLPHALRAGS